MSIQSEERKKKKMSRTWKRRGMAVGLCFFFLFNDAAVAGGYVYATEDEKAVREGEVPGSGDGKEEPGDQNTEDLEDDFKDGEAEDEGEDSEDQNAEEQGNPKDQNTEGEKEDSETETGENPAVSENTIETKGVLGVPENENIVASGTYEQVVWYIDDNGKLTVDGEGEFAPSYDDLVSKQKRAPWFSERSRIRSAEIRLSGTRDASYMFSACFELESVDISRFDSSSVTDMSGMFSMELAPSVQQMLERLDLRGLDTSNVTNMSSMFNCCMALSELDISHFDTSNVTNMSEMFSGCVKLPSLDLMHFHTENVTDMSGMFKSCYVISSIDVSSFDTGRVTDMSEMFAFCFDLVNLDVSHFDTRNVTDMGSMFEWCQQLPGINVSNFDTGQVTNMSRMFAECEHFKNLDLDNFNTSKVTDMSYMFDMCIVTYETTDLSQYYIDTGSFDTGNVTNMAGMFMYCAAGHIDVSGFDTADVTDMHDMFYGCMALQELDLSGFDTAKVTNMSGMFSGVNCPLDLHNFDTGKVTDMNRMFMGCKYLQELDVSSFNTAQVTNMNRMFMTCCSLQELDLGSFNTENVTDMAYMFASFPEFGEFNELRRLDLHSFDTGNVTDMHRMFYGCEKLESLDVSGFDTRNVRDMVGMFEICNSLTVLDLSNFDCSSWTVGGEADEYETWNGLIPQAAKLMRIYTPCNLPGTFDSPLPKEGALDSTTAGTWYDMDNNSYTKLPAGLQYSILLEQNQRPVSSDIRLVVKKTKTKYICGDTLSLDDLSVIYYGADGIGRKIELGNGDGTEGYTTNASQIDMAAPGEKELVVTYQNGSSNLTGKVTLYVMYGLTADNTKITLPSAEKFSYVYDGSAITPSPTVTVTLNGNMTTLVKNQDYIVSWQNNIDAYCMAEMATADQVTAPAAPAVVITGMGNYDGTLTQNFDIKKAVCAEETKLIFVPDCTVSDSSRTLNLSEHFASCGKKTAYHIESVTEDAANKGNVFARIPVDEDISPAGILQYSTNAGMPGDSATVRIKVSFVNYEDSVLTVNVIFAEDQISYAVNFEDNGHGGAEWENSRKTFYVRAGGMIAEPGISPEEGYIFTGWYSDRGLTKKWDFITDTVQADMTLYAGWLYDRSAGQLQMYIQDIDDRNYTGSAVKPNVIVYDSDGKTILRAGKDYTVRYCNNINAGGADVTGAVAKVINPGRRDEELQPIMGAGGQNSEEKQEFTKEAPYIVITGKGNYTETIYKNFCILPANIAAEGTSGQLAAGFTLKYTDQFVKSQSKNQKPLGSMKYKKSMKAGADYTVILSAVNAYDENENAVSQDWKVESSAANGWNPAIPKGYRGTFLMTVKGLADGQGTGNYQGEIQRAVCVADKTKLMKNAVITLGKNQKSGAYNNGHAVTLTPGYYDVKTKKYYKVKADGVINKRPEDNANNIFTVRIGKDYLIYGIDYTVEYENNKSVGTAAMTVKGKNQYCGTKSVSYKVVGETFKANTIIVKPYDPGQPDDNDFKSVMPYTGGAVTQNRVKLTTKTSRVNPVAKQLTYGKHYTISYKNNVKKGTATMIFTAKPESGYSGSFQKKFKIGAVDIADESSVRAQAVQGEEQYRIVSKKDGGGKTIYELDGKVEYTREGAKPSAHIMLSTIGQTGNGAETVLKEGKDYTVSYAYNTIRKADESSSKKPQMIIKGKGNYTGSLVVTYEISDVTMENNPNLHFAATASAFDTKKAETHVYQPKITVKDGKKTLANKKDYTVEYKNCTQKAVREYLTLLGSWKNQPDLNGTATWDEVYSKRPYALIKAIPGSGYITAGEGILVDLNIYETKLSNGNIYVVVSEGTGQNIYTGVQLKPDVAVYYGTTDAVREAKKNCVREGAVLTNPDGAYRLARLSEQTPNKTAGDYILVYGTNVAAGKNKGSVAVIGSGSYGGSITVKFNIEKKPVCLPSVK